MAKSPVLRGEARVPFQPVRAGGARLQSGPDTRACAMTSSDASSRIDCRDDAACPRQCMRVFVAIRIGDDGAPRMRRPENTKNISETYEKAL
ncbi:hypothetical protein KDW41_22085 [Burkholderia vietnamiensis]|nr:hypothetical protein [Burkholderia vietnamiensis]